MIVVNPDNTSHTISLVPRFDIESVTEDVQAFVDRVTGDSGTVESEDCTADVLKEDYIGIIITDNFKSISSSVDNTFDIQDGKIVITFDYDFRSESRYDVAITYTNTLEVIYRGIFIATTQDTQDYKLTKDKFYY
tara:strand:+ start:45 stop:449 length:405 start_codon:yes stop_codon:yes gene_type:complete